MAARRQHSFWFPLLGLGFAIAGADKILGARGYEAMFERWAGARRSCAWWASPNSWEGSWYRRGQRRRGGLLLTVTSTAVLTKELNQQDTDLATPRLALLLASVTALFA